MKIAQHKAIEIGAPKKAHKPTPKRFWGSLAGTVSYVGDIVSSAAPSKRWSASMTPR
jgi:hypothetical protein